MSSQKEIQIHRRWLPGSLRFLFFFNCRKDGRPIPITKVALIFYFDKLFNGCHFVYLFELLAHQGLHIRMYPKHVLNKLNMFLNIKKCY